jgi:hypothetical protein
MEWYSKNEKRTSVESFGSAQVQVEEYRQTSRNQSYKGITSGQKVVEMVGGESKSAWQPRGSTFPQRFRALGLSARKSAPAVDCADQVAIDLHSTSVSPLDMTFNRDYSISSTLPELLGTVKFLLPAVGNSVMRLPGPSTG